MAIELKIESYCENCPNMKPIKREEVLYADNEACLRYISIECENKKVCKNIERYIRRELEREYDESRTEESGEGKKES